MNRRHNLPIVITALFWAGLWSLPVEAALIHCDVKGYSATNFETVPVPPANYGPGGNAATLNVFQFRFQLPRPPASAGPDCSYEISDITEVSITFGYLDGPMTWGLISIDGVAAPGGPFAFARGVPLILAFPAHNNPGAIERTLPRRIGVSLFNDSNNFTILNATSTVSGNHYYVESVPEPTTLTLAGVGGLYLWLRRCQGKRRRLRVWSPRRRFASDSHASHLLLSLWLPGVNTIAEGTPRHPPHRF